MVTPRTCSDCERPARPGGRQCHACYQRRYRRTPEGKRRHNDAVIRYNASHPEKHRTWSRRWRRSIGYWNPELRDVQRALSALDWALGRAGRPDDLRLSGEQGGDGDPEW